MDSLTPNTKLNIDIENQEKMDLFIALSEAIKHALTFEDNVKCLIKALPPKSDDILKAFEAHQHFYLLGFISSYIDISHCFYFFDKDTSKTEREIFFQASLISAELSPIKNKKGE